MKEKKKLKQVHVVMPEVLDEQLQQLADKRTLSKGAFIRTLIKEEAKRNGAE